MPDLRRQRQGRQVQRRIQAATNSSRGQEVLREPAEIGHQAVQGVMLGVDGPHNFIHRTREFARRAVDPVHVRSGPVSAFQVAPHRLTQQGDASQTRPQIVMDVARNAGALSLERALPLQMLHPPAHTHACHRYGQGRHRHGGSDRQGNCEPPCLPDVGQDSEGQGRTFFVPHVIIVASDDLKIIGAWRQIAVFRDASGSCIYPFVLQAPQLVLKPDLIRRGKAQPGVTQFKTLLAGWNLQHGCRIGPTNPRLGSVEFDWLPFHDQFLDHDGRRNRIGRETAGIDDRQPLRRRKPQPPVGGFADPGLEPA